MTPPTPLITSERWLRIKQIAADALDRPASERGAVADAACGADAALRDEVRSLLTSIDAAADSYETPLFDPAALRAALVNVEDFEDLVGRRIGPYKVVAELGRGGMGAAYLAERDDHAFERRVAVKVVKRGMDTDAILQRFRHERQILANLNHPNIATLLDGGTTDDGRPYFVMEWVDGRPIDEYCDRARLSLRDRLTLFRHVCDAVHYAHENRVVHRDLKPGNVLVTARGVPKLLDFGIAKVLEQGAGAEAPDTRLSGPILTPLCASPEQIRGERVTVASDVYSLGVLLHVLVTGRPPSRLENRTAEEAQRIICEEIPPAVSSAQPITVNGAPGTAEWRGELKGKVDAIVATALQKRPNRRYASARDLATDVQRYLDGVPVAARRVGYAERLFSDVRRSRTGMAVTGAVLLVAALAIAAAALRRGQGAASVDTVDSIAVLPFVNTAGDRDIDFLVDGITDSLITRFSRVSAVRVISRDSAHRLKGPSYDPVSIGRQLGVRAVLIGTVSSQGGHLRVSAELLDARTRARLWSSDYGRQVGEIQALESELVLAVASHLKLPFASAEAVRVRQTVTASPEAYQLYLRGRYVWNKRTPNDLEKSIEYFAKAVADDPRFALAYSGLADSYGLLTEYHTASADETYGKAKHAAITALSLDPDLAEAYTSRAYIKQFYEWDLPGAEQDFTRALAINPNYATAWQWYGELLCAMGRHDEALAAVDRAKRLDPLSLIISSVEAYILYMGRNYDGAIDKSLQIIQMDAAFPETYEYLKRSYDQKGAYADAITARQTRRRLLGRSAGLTPALKVAAGATDRGVYWRARLAQELDEGKDEGLLPFEMAEIYAQLGDAPRALDWLDQACSAHDFLMVHAGVYPTLGPIRGEPRFQALLRRGCRM